MKTDVLILPGYGNSDDNHWQSLWERNNPSFKRVIQKDWESPNCIDWIKVLEQHVEEAGPSVKIVAHSLGCLLLSQWAAQTQLSIAGALLVAIPDPSGDNFPQKAIGFSATVMKTKFVFPSTVIASNNDLYSELAFSQACAEQWGSEFIDLGKYGHINSSSGLKDWPFGREQLALIGS